ncbi:MAG TPA: electron transfer flavoprotein subunit alpha/FixB family protein [Bacteroidota bacterium]|nr:electron transfer flavoprotein subunit alpha/FixB family protein [Bacteroidota bacterium]
MKILVYIEQRENSIKKSSLEALSYANLLASSNNGEVVAVIIGGDLNNQLNELSKYGANKIIVCQDPKFEKYSSSAYSKILIDIIKKENANIIFLSATSLGKDLAPRLAAKLDAGLCSDCTSIVIENNDMIITRPVYAGKALIDVKLKSEIKIYTLRPNVFPLKEVTINAQKEEYKPELTDLDFISFVKEITLSKGKKDVAEADIIVTGGRGMKGPEHFHLIEELADLLGAAVGASRSVVDAGWRPHSEQVGQTGKTVSPTLYIACGVSGAIQHIAGMSSSKHIIAINKDKDAPIFQYADYGIVGDVFEVLPELIKELKVFLGK